MPTGQASRGARGHAPPGYVLGFNSLVPIPGFLSHSEKLPVWICTKIDTMDNGYSYVICTMKFMLSLKMQKFLDCFSSSADYLSNRPQVSMGYRLINHAGCW